MRKQSDIEKRTERRTDDLAISNRILSDRRGLSTMEYAVLFLVIVVVAIGAWKSLGDSVDTSVKKGQKQLSELLNSAASASSETLSNRSGFSSGSNPVNGARWSSSTRGGGSSEGTTNRASGSSSSPSGSAQHGSAPSAVGVSKTGTTASATSASNARAADSTQASRDSTKSSASPTGSSSRGGRSSSSATSDEEEPSLWERAKTFFTESQVVETIAKEAAMMAAESVVPGLAAFNAGRTLTDDDASMLDKTFAAVQLATSIVPPVAAGVKTIGKVTKVGLATYKTAKAGSKVAKATGGVVDDVVKAAAHTGSKYGDDVSGVLKRMTPESSISPSSGVPVKGGGNVIEVGKTKTISNATRGIARVVPGSLPAVEEAAVVATLKHIRAGTKPAGKTAKKWGAKFKNWSGDLPGAKGKASPYREYRVAPSAGTSGAGIRRVVVNGKTGEMYYSWTHYGDTGAPAFVQIR